MSITVQSRRQSLTPELARLNREIEVHARDYDLDFYETFFEVLDFEEMNMVAAYGGFRIVIPTGNSAWNTNVSTKVTPTVCTKFTRWSSIMTRATPTCSSATISSTRRS